MTASSANKIMISYIFTHYDCYGKPDLVSHNGQIVPENCLKMKSQGPMKESELGCLAHFVKYLRNRVSGYRLSPKICFISIIIMTPLPCIILLSL